MAVNWGRRGKDTRRSKAKGGELQSANGQGAHDGSAAQFGDLWARHVRHPEARNAGHQVKCECPVAQLYTVYDLLLSRVQGEREQQEGRGAGDIMMRYHAVTCATPQRVTSRGE